MKTSNSITLLTLTCLIVAGSLLASCAGVDAPTRRTAVEQKPLISSVVLSGTIRTAEAVELLAPVIDMWPIPIQTLLEDGTPVTKGQPIAEFDSTNLASGLQESRDRVIETETALLTARARLAAEEADARFEVESKRLALEKASLDAAVPEELKPQREYQNLQLALRRAELDYQAAKDKLESQLRKAAAELGIAQVELDKARLEVNRTEQALEVVVLTAPHDGILEVAYNREEGRPYRPGDNARPGLPVARFPDYDTLRVEASLFDVDQGLVEVGSPAIVTLDAYPTREFQAIVTDVQEIAQEVSSRSSRRVFRMLVDLLDPDVEVMKVGMSARVEIRSVLEQWQGQPTRVVPRAALIFSPGTTTTRATDQAGTSSATASDTSIVLAELLTPQGAVTAEVGRCSLCECAILGVEAGQPISLPNESLGDNRQLAPPVENQHVTSSCTAELKMTGSR